jgi:hypothetical protein
MFGGRKFSINRHTGEPKPLTRRFSNVEPSANVFTNARFLPSLQERTMLQNQKEPLHPAFSLDPKLTNPAT